MPITRDLTKAERSSRPVDASDGSDFSYRMVIKDRYKVLVATRRSLKRAAIVQLIYILVRGAWKSIPTLVKGYPMETLDHSLLIGGLLLFAVYGFGFGFGKPQNERNWAIMLYCIGNMVLFAEYLLTFWMYHVIHGAKSANPQDRATYPYFVQVAVAALSQTFNLTAEQILIAKSVLMPFEATLEIFGLMVTGVNVWLVKEYLIEKKYQKDEKKGKKKM